VDDDALSDQVKRGLATAVRHAEIRGMTNKREEITVSELIDELTALEKRLVLEHTSALATVATQPQGVPFAPVELSRIADIYTALQARVPLRKSVVVALRKLSQGLSLAHTVMTPGL
jgi:hypothetical protein